MVAVEAEATVQWGRMGREFGASLQAVAALPFLTRLEANRSVKPILDYFPNRLALDSVGPVEAPS
jgi:hypothetical protein